MGLAQQVALAVMLDNDPPSSPSRVLLSIRRSSEKGLALCVFLLALPRCYPYVT
jgi:hypothetical protein